MSNPLRKLVPAPQGAGTAGSVGPARPQTLGTRVHDVLHRNATLGPLFVLLLAVIVFSASADRFLEPGNLSLIVQQVMVVGTLGIAQTLVILTLGTLNVFVALNLWYSESATIRGTDMPDLLLWTGNTIDVGDTRITYGSLLMLALFGVFAWVLKNTAWGRHVYAVGDDAEAARLAGVRKDRVLLSVYIVAGLVCAVAAWMLIGRIASASPQAGISANLDSITAVVIGGTSLFGGRGLVIGTLFGALIVGVLRNGLTLAGVDVLWQDFAVGILIIAAVAIDQWIRKVKA